MSDEKLRTEFVVLGAVLFAHPRKSFCRAGFRPDPYPEFGQCVHKIVAHKDAPGRLYMQNHGGWGNWDGPGGKRPDIGVLRSDDHGRRTCPGGAPAVWRSENGGGSWKKLARGFPRRESFFTVQRDAMDIDDLASPALYFGTTTGQLWIGRDGGEAWECLYDSLPPIHCVKVALV